MRSRTSPFRKKELLSLDSASGPRPYFSVPPVLTGNMAVGDTLTLTFTPVGVGALTASVQFLRDGSVVDTQTPVIATTVEETLTYITAATGTHFARITLTDDNGTQIGPSNQIITFGSTGPFSTSFSDSFNIFA